MRNYKKEYENYHSKPEQKIRRAARNAARRRFADADPNKDVHHKDNDPLNNDVDNLSLVTQHYNRKEPRLREKKLKDLQAKLTKALTQKENVQEAENQLFRNRVAQYIQVSGRHDSGGVEQRIMFKSSDAMRKSTRAFQLHFEKQRSSSVRELIAKAVNKAMEKKTAFQIWDAKFAKMITTFGEDMAEDVYSDAKAFAVVVNKYMNSKNTGEKAKLKKQMQQLQKKLGLKVKEDMGSTTGAHIAGTGDDNTVHTRRKKKKKITPARRNDISGRIELIKGMVKKRKR